MSTYYAILTAVGEAKLANATALGTVLQLSKMAVGDGNGALPNPVRTQTALVRETYRADLNTLSVDPVNASQIIAELVIPETEGGYWLRELGIYDAAGDLFAVANCPPSYKPQMAEGSGRTQVLRMVLIVSSTAAVQLKIDPSVVLATREFVTTTVAAELAKLDSKQSVRVATTGPITASGMLTVDGVQLVAGERVLRKNEDDAKLNGIYLVANGAWPRAADADASIEVTPGMLVLVESGQTNADSLWQLVTDAPIVLGTTPLAFEIASGPVGIAAGSYRSVTIDKRGRVIGGTNPTTLAGYGISDAQPLHELLTRFAENSGFGLGGSVISLVDPDLNSDRPTGFYYCNSPKNGPGNNGWLLHQRLGAAGEYATQTYIAFGQPSRTFQRTKTSGWGDWQDCGGIGAGQSWQDVTANRAWATTYTNTTGRPIQVSITARDPAAGNLYIGLWVGGVRVAEHFYGASMQSAATAIVPPGATYKVERADNNDTITSWLELR